MARLDEYMGDNIANVSEVVGKRGMNLVGDVYVVQALLELNTNLTFSWASKPVEVNGRYSSDVERLIADYQNAVRRRSHRMGYWVAGDSRVASYKSGVALLRGQQWTIVSLNNDMLATILGYRSAVDYISRKFPQVVVHLTSS